MHSFKVGDWVYVNDWCYGQIMDIDKHKQDAVVEFDTGSGGGSMFFNLEDLEPAPAPTKLDTLRQYHFDRTEMSEAFFKVFTTDEYVDIKVACGANTHLDDFSLFYWEDEFYILHRNSGVMINWYKNMGRTNTCNRPDFTIDDFREFLKKLREDLVWNKVIDDVEMLEEMADAGWDLDEED
jgi:hypothetical protein